MIYSEADIKPQWAPCSQDNNRKVLSKWQNDTGFSKSTARSHSVYSFPTQTPTQTEQSLSNHQNKYIFFDNIFLPPSVWTKLLENNILYVQQRLHAPTEVEFLSPSSTRLLDLLLRIITLPFYFQPCRGVSAWSFILMKWDEPGAKGRYEWRERELFCYRTQCNDAIYN